MLIDTRTHEQLEGVPLEEVVSQPKEDEVIATLTRVRARIEQGWTQGAMRDGNNYCIIGAVEKESIGVSTSWHGGAMTMPGEFALIFLGEVRRTLSSRTYRRTIRALKRQAGKLTFVGLADVNDEALHKQDMLDLVDATIERRKRHL